MDTIYMHNIETGQAASASIQGAGDYLWVEASDLPPWANPVSANFMVHLAATDREESYTHAGIAYIIPSPILPCLRMSA